MDDLYQQLLRARQQLQGLLLVVVACTILTLFSGGILLVSWLDSVQAIQEWQAGALLAVVGLMLLLALVGLLGVTWRYFPGLVTLTSRIDRKHQATGDALACAVELMETRNGQLSAIEAAQIRHAQRQLADMDPVREWLPRWVHPYAVVPVIVVAVVLVMGALQSTLTAKAWLHYRDLMGGEPSGLSVTPGNVELPIGADLTITASVQRWQNEADIVISHQGEQRRYPMLPDHDGTLVFTQYRVDEPFTYQVISPSLVSPVYQVMPYPPPVIEQLQWQILPPAYTGLEATTYTETAMRDVAVPEGSEVEIRVSAPHAESILLRNPDQVLARGPVMTLTATEAQKLQFILHDAAGRKHVSAPFQLDIIPDEPPLIEVLVPAEDVETELESVVAMEFYGGDDYGLTDMTLHVSVSGLNRLPQTLPLPDDEPLLEATLLSGIEPQDVGAENESVITYYLTATDNRQPEPQTSRSEIYFITVTDPNAQPDIDNPLAGSDEAAEINLNLDTLITELKRLIRETHKLQSLEAEPQRDARVRTASELSALRIELTRFSSLLGQFLQLVEGGEFFAMLSDSVASLETAARTLIDQGDIEFAKSLQVEALGNLNQLKAYLDLLAEPPSPSSSGGQGSQNNNEGQAQQEPSETGPSPQALAQARDALMQLAEQQQNLNRDYQRADQFGASQGELNELYEQQMELRNELESVVDAIDARRNPALSDSTTEATTRMEAAAVATAGNQPGQAQRDGMRGRAAMVNLAAQLDSAIQAAMAASVSSLADQAGGLAQAQQSLREATGQTNPADLPEWQPQQEALRQQLQQLLQQTESTADALRELAPEAAEALSRAAESRAGDRAQTQMQRSSNALRYRRQDRAQDFQAEAQAQLETLSEAIAASQQGLPASEMAELLSLLQAIDRESQQMEAGQGTEASREALGTQMEASGQTRGNDTLRSIGESLQSTGIEAATVDGLLRQATEAVLRELLRQQMDAINNQGGQRVAPPPEVYRQMVEDYFRSLAE